MSMSQFENESEIDFEDEHNRGLHLLSVSYCHLCRLEEKEQEAYKKHRAQRRRPRKDT